MHKTRSFLKRRQYDTAALENTGSRHRRRDQRQHVRLTLADAGYEVTLIVPGKELDGGNSALAQGGIVYRSDPNDAKDLEKDILIAGHHHNYVKAVRHLCQHGPEAVERILMERAPIPFDRLDGKLDFTREGGHGKHRIVHCADHTGKTIMEGLLQAVRMSPNIRILTGAPPWT